MYHVWSYTFKPCVLHSPRQSIKNRDCSHTIQNRLSELQGLQRATARMIAMKTASCKTTSILIGALEVTHGTICTPKATTPRMAGFWSHNSNPVHGLQQVNMDSMGRTSEKINLMTLSLLFNSPQDSCLNTLSKTKLKHPRSGFRS